MESEWLQKEEMLRLQQSIRRLMVKRNIAIECPPVSNLRISQYSSIKEHHTLRWLGIEGYRQEHDARLSICLGSDDPGIFVTDLENEFYHLFCLLQSVKISPVEAVQILRQLNDTGRIYAFSRVRELGKSLSFFQKSAAARRVTHAAFT